MLSTTIAIHRKYPTLFKQQRVKIKSLEMEQDIMITDIFGKCNDLHIKHDEETFFFGFRYILKGVGRQSPHISKQQHLEKGFYGNSRKLDVYHFLRTYITPWPEALFHKSLYLRSYCHLFSRFIF